MEDALIHPASADEALLMLAAAICEVDGERHTGLETSTPCPLHVELAERTLAALERRTSEGR